jgi:hypothetical protein
MDHIQNLLRWVLDRPYSQQNLLSTFQQLHTYNLAPVTLSKEVLQYDHNANAGRGKRFYNQYLSSFPPE